MVLLLGRYYSQNTTKALSRSEALELSAKGLYIVTVYQDSNKTVDYFTYQRGKDDCNRAIDQAVNVGQPYGSVIYFAVDFDARTTTELDAVVQYFNGVQDAMRLYKDFNFGNGWILGVYGSYTVVDHVYNHVADVAKRWQTYAWSGGLQTNWDLYQYQNDITFCGVNVDRNKSNGAGGGFKVSG